MEHILPNKADHDLAFIDKFRYNAAKSSEAQSRIKKLERMPVLEAPESDYVVHFKFPDVEKLSPPIVQMSEISFGYSKDKPLLKNVDLDVQLDSRIGIVGPNGAGKTTVLKLLTGQLEPTSGLLSQHARLRIGYFAQHHVDALDLTTSAVSFMAKTYPGKTDEEYRRHLGAYVEPSIDFTCCNALLLMCDFYLDQIRNHWNDWTSKDGAPVWRTKISCRVCLLVVDKPTHFGP